MSFWRAPEQIVVKMTHSHREQMLQVAAEAAGVVWHDSLLRSSCVQCLAEHAMASGRGCSNTRNALVSLVI
jgi:hypothetical protein